jgi:hypothetical protein
LAPHPPPPVVAPPPPPRDDWKFTGSWGKGAYTKGWGPPSGKVATPASKHPEVYSIKGSINRALTGTLSIIAAECKGWTVISFSGADVQSVSVASASGEVLTVTLSVSTQTWTPYVMSMGRRKKRGALGKDGLAMAQLSSTPKPNELTAGATYTVTVTVAEPLTFDDVNAYFVTVPCKEPFSAPGHAGGAGPPAKPTPPETQEEPCDVPTPTPTPDVEPCDVEPATKAPTMAPTKAPTPSSCSDCVDKEPPSNWAEPTCAGQLSSGKCAERVRMADGYCMATCGICEVCKPVDTVHGDPMFKHNGEGFKFSIPVGRPTDLLSWRGKGGKKAVLSGTAFERVRTGNQWFDSLALTVGGKEVFNVSVAKVARGSLRMVVDGELMNPSDVDTFTSRDLSTTMVSSIMSKKFKIGHKSAQTLQVMTLGDVRFTVLSAKAAKYDGERGQFDYRHLNVKLDSGMPSGATGIFAELSGAAPITAATKQLLADPLAFDLAMSRARTDGKSIEISGEN